jgi:N-acetylglucosamine-6-phosphate deacetylase
LVDLQVNGGFGLDLAREPARALAALSERLPRAGVTAYLPTLVSSATPVYEGVFAALTHHDPCGGASALGLHLEGPLLAPTRAGAHARAAIEAADAALLDRLFAHPAVRLVTLAPERPGALARIRALVACGVVVSMGHTDATYDQCMAAVEAGARMATHLGNAMSPLHQREPGATGAALSDDRVAVSLIADGLHVHPAVLALAARAKGAERTILVSDAVAGAGAPRGRYTLADHAIDVDEHSARLQDGTLAGAVALLDAAVRNLVRLAGVPVADALRMASETPARVLALAGKGRLEPGYDADLVVLDDELAVAATIIGGRVVYRR